jgi:Domain of unknown function (DUF4397)
MQPKFLGRPISLALGILVLFALFGVQAHPAAATTSPTYVRIVDATPDAGITDMFVDGTKLVANFEFGTVTSYVPIPAGRHKWEMALIGKGPNAPVISQVILCDPGEPYTIAAYGTKASGLKLGLFSDDNELVSGMTKIRVYHLAPNIGSVSVTEGATPIVSGLTYPQGSKYAALSPGSYTFSITDNTSNAVASVSTRLETNTVESIFVIGRVNATSQLQVITTQAKGVPALPQTGSDPNPVVRDTPVMVPWLWIVLVLGAIGVVVGSLRLGLTRKQSKEEVS